MLVSYYFLWRDPSPSRLLRNDSAILSLINTGSGDKAVAYISRIVFRRVSVKAP
jgi:hypothetical protein